MPVPLVVNGAALACTMGTVVGSGSPGPGSLTTPPAAQVVVGDAPVGDITDIAPLTNIATFGMCVSLNNPEVASATSAAQGVLTPQPCTPNVAGPWQPGCPTVLVGGNPAIDQACTCRCVYGGVISVLAPGQETVLG